MKISCMCTFKVQHQDIFDHWFYFPTASTQIPRRGPRAQSDILYSALSFARGVAPNTGPVHSQP